VLGQLIQAAAGRISMDGEVYILDAQPIPVCRPMRHGRVRLLREDGAYFGKTSSGWFFGFRIHVLVHHSGPILAAVLTPGNWHEQDAALALALSVGGGIGRADGGYRGRELVERLAPEAQLLLLTPPTVGPDKAQRRGISSLRQRVETTVAALWDRFIDRVYSRSWEGLWSTLKLKLLPYNRCRAGVIPA